MNLRKAAGSPTGLTYVAFAPLTKGDVCRSRTGQEHIDSMIDAALEARKSRKIYGGLFVVAIERSVDFPGIQAATAPST
jgi:hypothetical protein